MFYDISLKHILSSMHDYIIEFPKERFDLDFRGCMYPILQQFEHVLWAYPRPFFISKLVEIIFVETLYKRCTILEILPLL